MNIASQNTMSSNRFDYFQLLSEIEQYESAIDHKYAVLIETNEQTYRQIEQMLNESLDRKLNIMRNITTSLIELRNEGFATAPTHHAS